MNKINSKLLMSCEKQIEKNKSKSLTLNKNQNNANNQSSRQQIIKKNKIINIRIYQNYSNDKNSTTFFNPCSNNFINNINIPLKVTNEIGVQTITEKNLKNDFKNNSNIKNNVNIGRITVDNNKNEKELQKDGSHYNFSKTFSVGFKSNKIIKNENTIKRKKKGNNIIKNYSSNLNYKKRQIINLKSNIQNKKDKNKLFEVNEDLNNSNKNINKANKTSRDMIYYNKKNEINNKSDEKNKIAKRYSLFNLQNDNKYLIINDGNYDSHYHESSKLSINNIYLKKDNKNENNKNMIQNVNTSEEKKFNNYLNDEKNLYYTNVFYSINNIKNFANDNIAIQEEKKDIVNKYTHFFENNIIKVNKKFEKLSIIKNNNIFIKEEKKFSDINDIYKARNKDIFNDDINYYKKFITNINNNYNINKFFFKDGTNDNIEKKNVIKEINIKKVFQQKNNINNITKNSFEIISKKFPKETKRTNQIITKEKNKINKNVESNKNKANENKFVNLIKTNKEKDTKKVIKKHNSKIKENKNINKKYESFLYDLTQEDENGIKFEDLLKTYTDESIKGNQSIEELNNKIIGDEKTFFNNSKIPKIEECSPHQHNLKENDMNFYNQIKPQNMQFFQNNDIEKNTLEKKLDKIRNKRMTSKQEKDPFEMIKDKISIKKEEDEFDKILKPNKTFNPKKNYIFNIDKNYQKNLNKEKMYNFLFNQKPNLNDFNNKEQIFNLKDKENDGINPVNIIINKLNAEIKSSTSIQFLRKNNTAREKFLNYKKRNKSYKNSYSKYYLNKLEIENKLLIPQLSKKNEDFFNIKFFNINKFK